MVEEKLDNIYSLYEDKKYEKALSLNDEVLKEDPNNIYAKRYSSLLLGKIKSGVKSDIPKVKGKQLKCPHCESKISFSALTESQQKEIKSGNYNNLELKCPYCHTKFVLQKRTAKSILGLKIGEIINYDGKEYRITGYVEYTGTWTDKKYSGFMTYLEWILLGKDNSYLYFSEGYFNDEGEQTYEYEFSEKYIPKEKVNTKTYKEKNLLTVKSVYGENSKSYKIGEKVEILDFGNYVLEKEGSGSQLEAGFYKGKKVNKREAVKIFNKKISERELFSGTSIMGLTGFKKYISVGFFGIIIGLILFLVVPPYLSKSDTIEIGKSYYLGGEHKNYNGTTTCSDDGDTRTCYSYTKSKGLAFSIKDEKDIELYNKLKTGTISDEKLKKITSGSLYSFYGDYTSVNIIKGSWFFLFIFLLLGTVLLFGKSDD